MYDEIYDQGFIDKCAERGVDPEALIKLAAKAGLIKKVVGAGKKVYDSAKKGLKTYKGHLTGETAETARKARMESLRDIPKKHWRRKGVGLSGKYRLEGFKGTADQSKVRKYRKAKKTHESAVKSRKKTRAYTAGGAGSALVAGGVAKGSKEPKSNKKD